MGGEFKNKIIQGDSLTILKTLPDNLVDCCITDPPYNISKLNDRRDRNKLNSPIMRREKSINYDFGDWDNMQRGDFLSFTRSWLRECCRIIKDGGTIISFFSKEDISYLGWVAKKYGIRTRTIFTWCKSNPVPSFRKVNYLSATEFIWIGSKGDKAWTFNFSLQKYMSNFMITPNKSSYGETEHPNEKPKSLIKHLLEIHSNEGDLILDPFFGSGTVGAVAKGLGRDYLGIELNPKYIAMAEKRIAGTDGKQECIKVK